jgi:TRAP transporter 4TM/12TM fusion protein
MEGMNTPTPTQNLDQILEKYDSEARFRTFTSAGVARFVSLLAVGLALFHLITAYTGPLITLQHRALHTGVVIALVFLLYPATNRSSRRKASVLDFIAVLVSFVTTAYIFYDFSGIVQRAGSPNQSDTILGLLVILLVLEGGRRIVGSALTILCLAFLAYAYLGPYMPTIIGHRGYSITDIVNYMYLTTEGIYGVAIGVSATYIFLFILFGSFLEKTGMGQLFSDASMAVAGHSSGGPAKVSVISSGLLGSINGSAIANVVTTGAFTIPLMKRIGYRPNFAGAVEAAASVGGQIIPPVMGATAFIMAETLGMSYGEIALAAIIPGFLYYLGVIMMVHFRAKSRGMVGLSKEELPKISTVFKERGHLLIPLVILVYMLFGGYTPIFAAFFSIIITVVVAQFRATTRLGVKDIYQALEGGTRSALSVAMSCAMVGLIVGVATLTGFGLKLTNAILVLGGGSMFLTLIFTMLASIILGMGLPSIPTYIITSSMAAPALAAFGVAPFVSHMFVFYFGILANLTPPVALAAFAGAGVAGGNPTQTGFISLRLAAAGVIVPYIFVYSPEMLMQNDATITQILTIATTASIGVIALAAAMEGFIITRLHALLRVIILAGAVLLMIPGLYTDSIGVGIIAIVLIIQSIIKKKTSSKVA